MPTSWKVEVQQVSHVFRGVGGVHVRAIADVTLHVAPGSFVSLIGPSGCGKSTLFNIIAGLLRPTQGSVLVDGREVTGHVGLVGYMLQKDLLLPWRTVLDNVALGLELRGLSLREAREHALPYLYRYGLRGFENLYPSALSGGMRQRVALLRTLLYDSDVILLDEPFGALDAQTRFRMQEWLLQIWSDVRKTVLLVTHDVEEAVYLSDVVYVLSARPARVKSRLDVSLPRPRPRTLVTAPEFIRVKEACLQLLMDEVSDEAGEKADPVAVKGAA